MLQTIRDRAHGWIAWAIIVFISVPFAFWGIESYLGMGGEPVAAVVNGVDITQAALDRQVQTARMQLRERLGAAYDASRIDDKRLRQEVLDSMIRETLLVDVSHRLGMRVSARELQDQIMAEPAFQRGGRFDNASYQQVLELQGQSPSMFEANLRQRMVGTQIVRGVVESELVTQSERNAFQRLSGQQRELAWLRIPAARFAGTEPIGEDAIKAYYAANAARFTVPEQVKLDYLILDVASLAAKAEIPDDELRHAYESDQARFGQPERRKVRHILLTVSPGADAAADAAVRKEIEGVRKRLGSGEAFDAVAKAVSKDPGSASQGGSLGEIEKGMMDPAFEEAAFSQAVGQVGAPVKTRFGYHLILVESIVPPAVKPFAAVRDQLRGELAKQRAESAFYDKSERLGNLVYESASTLEPAAKALGLEIRHSDWVGRKGGAGVLGNPKVTAAAFSDEVLNDRRNSDAIEPEKDVLQVVVVRVTDHRDAAPKPLDQVRAEIVAELTKERGRKGALAAALAGAQKLKAGADWKAIAGADQPVAGTDKPVAGAEKPAVGAEKPVARAEKPVAGAEKPVAGTEKPVPGVDKVEGPGLVGRNDPKLPPPVLAAAFVLPVPAKDKASVGTAVFDDGDAAILRVTRVVDGKTGSGDQAIAGAPSAAAQESSMLGQAMGRQVYDALVRDLERRADIERKPLAVAPPEG